MCGPNPRKSKSTEDVSRAFEDILKEGWHPRKLQTDQRKEYYNVNFKQLLKKYNINHYNTFRKRKVPLLNELYEL